MPRSHLQLYLRNANGHLESSKPAGSDLLSPANPGEEIFSAEEWVAIAQAANLSSREWRIAVHLCEGLSRKEIAQKMKVSLNAVRAYIDRLFAKLHVKNLVGAILRLVRIHWQLTSRSMLH